MLEQLADAAFVDGHAPERYGTGIAAQKKLCGAPASS